MMTASGSCRKRSRSEEDDCDGCLPIAKRITRLHIWHEGCASDEDYLEPLRTDNNNASGVACCRQPWCDNPPDSVRGAPGPPGSGSPQSPPALPGVPGSPPWQPQAEFSHNSASAANNIVSELNGIQHVQPPLQNGPLLSPNAVCGMPISDNMLNVPGRNTDETAEHRVDLETYEPELGQMENPHYYHSNQVLYYAHLSRLQRLTSTPPNHATFH